MIELSKTSLKLTSTLSHPVLQPAEDAPQPDMYALPVLERPFVLVLQMKTEAGSLKPQAAQAFLRHQQLYTDGYKWDTFKCKTN